jgi:CDP-diacylglycerol---glycerol-3-phosphate 3-phosphatidyltransferase
MNLKTIPTIFENNQPNIFDRFFEKTILRLIPVWIKPNHLTVFRYITVPFILVLLVFEYYLIALVIFVFSAFSDMFDGSIARTRNNITEWGKLNDPIADKLLIGATGGVLILRYIGLILTLIVLGIEAIILLVAFYKKIKKKKMTSALFPGKVKMVLQSIALGLLFLYSIWPFVLILVTAEVLFYLAIFFALISLFVYGSI